MPRVESAAAQHGARALWFAGVGGGVLGGSAAGVLEAMWVLTSTAPSEYQAVLYGALIYGFVGLGAGVGLGGVAVLASSLVRVSPAFVWCGSFFGAWGGLGFFILRYLLNKEAYGEGGVPIEAELGVVASLLAASAVGVWFGHNLLTKTPLRPLARAKGSAALWCGGMGLAVMVAVAPAPAAVGLEVPSHPQDGTGTRPNVVFILIDALRYDALGVNTIGTHTGSGTIPGPSDSPNLDAFAADGIVFEQNIVSAPWTRASVASLFTGVPASTHGCAGKSDVLRQDVVTLAEALAGANYATGGFPNNPNVTGALGFAQGFDWYFYAPRYPLGATGSSYALSFYSVARKAYARLQPSKRVDEHYSPSEVQLQRAHSWIGAQRRDRWFSYVHLMEPHDPYFVHPYNGDAIARAADPGPAAERAEELRATYQGEVRHMDEELGRFFARLKQDGQYDSALIVVTSDHGEEFFEHGGWWHGATLFDEQVHVPLLVKLPRNDRAGTRVPWQTRAIDIPATILDVSGVPVPADWLGETLFSDDFDQQLLVTLPPPVEPGDPVLPWTRPTWGQLPASRAALSELDFDGVVLQSLRAEGKKLVEAPRSGGRSHPPEAVYDLERDPGEQTPMLDHPAADGLRVRLLATVGDRGAGLTPVDPSTYRRGLGLLGYPEEVP
ncbi:MAG: hypothetical protein EXR69_04455 [Myxococcales bacterium]|nr:hypothetical protein [Myxococcales bacterium]